MDRTISEGDALPRGPWDGIPADILGLVLDLMPCAADRARVRSVCRSWLAGAGTQRPPRPLPMLVFSRFSSASFSSFSPTMTITEYFRVPLHKGAAIRWVGSFDEWLVGTRRIREREKGDGHCFLVNAFSQQTIHLPQPSAFCFFDYFSKTLPIVNTSHSIQIDVHAREHLMCFRKVILSAPPASGSKCIVAAISNLTLALWHPGMASWCVCRSFDINVSSDIAFYQGRIYMASTHYPNILRILFFEIERFNGRVTVSYVEKCVTEPLPLVLNCVVKECYIVEWSGKLVLITIYVNCYLANVIRKIGIYALDFSTSPHSVTEINSLNGDCLFISSCSSKSFPACQYDGAKGDFVYLVSNYRQQTTSAHASFDVVVYNVRDATMTSFPVLVPEDNSGLFMDNLLWIFPPK